MNMISDFHHAHNEAVSAFKVPPPPPASRAARPAPIINTQKPRETAPVAPTPNWFMHGRLDLVKNGIIEGWAHSPESDSAAARLTIFVDNVVVGSVIADRYREDLATAGIAGGYAHFVFEIPIELLDGNAHRIDVLEANSLLPLEGSPIYFHESILSSSAMTKRVEWIQSDLLIRPMADEQNFRERVKATRRIAFLSTYHEIPSFMKYHQSYVRYLSECGFTTVIVHAGSQMNRALETIEDYDCFLIVKRNIGYDFGSWITGVFLSKDLLHHIDEMIFINDSNFPLPHLPQTVQRARSMGTDVVGLTDSYERKYHLQSYFLWFGPGVCNSSLLIQFFLNYSFSSNKELVIEEGELGLTKFLVDHGVRVGVIAPYQDVSARWLANVPSLIDAVHDLPASHTEVLGRDKTRTFQEGLLSKIDEISSYVMQGIPLNPTHFFWDTLIDDFAFPFIKRELVLLNPAVVPSYFRLSGALHALGTEFTSEVFEVIQRYNGKLVPSIGVMDCHRHDTRRAA